ncbi:hypothetical protein [Candidatus Poriferisocius sp.]|uniref:hypothetical protein n=1 Tax=Candidatus Poriferisocius sp. TaxID=3101276 RepID=UPI003B01E0D7
MISADIARRRPKSGIFRLAGLFLAIAMVVAACSQSTGEDQADPAATPATQATPAEQPAPSDETGNGEPDGGEPDAGDPDAGEPDTGGTGNGEPGAASGGLVPAGPDTPGVSDDKVTISFIVTDTSAVAAAFGWETPDEGDRKAQIEALIDHFNAEGGFAGRQIDAKVTVFNAITDGPVAEEALCNAITQDDKAFAVVMTGQLQENARPCYKNANTLMLDATLYPVDNVGFEELAPYYWSPLLPSYDDLVGGLAAGLIADNWFDGATLGVIAIDSELNKRVYEQQFSPRLDAAGVEVASYNTIDPTDATSFNNDQLQAIINFKEAGVDKVVAIGGSRLVSWFIETSITQNYAPAYAVTSYDAPEFNVFNFPEMMPGASGISVLPGYDVEDDQYPFPANPAEQECAGIFSGAGLEFTERANIRTGLIFCDALRLLAAASPHLSEVSAQGVSEAVWSLGDDFQPASVYGVEFTEGSYAGGKVYRLFRFDAECECMTLISGPKNFGE